MTRDVPFIMHILKVFHTCFGDLCEAVQHFWLIFETFANKKCVNVRYMKLREDFELFGNAKDFELRWIFDFIILFANHFLNIQMENKALSFMYLKNNWQGIKRKKIYHMSTCSICDSYQHGPVICPLSRITVKYICTSVCPTSSLCRHLLIAININQPINQYIFTATCPVKYTCMWNEAWCWKHS